MARLLTPVVLVPGTWGYGGSKADTAQWWYPGSPFWFEAKAHGLVLLGEHDPFEWSSDLPGLVGRRWTHWKAAGQALRWFALSYGHHEVDVIAHSWGGCVAVYAAARPFVRGFGIRRLVTVDMPERSDMDDMYQRAGGHVERWTHLRAGWNLWSVLGRLTSRGGQLPATVAVVEDPQADHRTILEPARWSRRDWWGLLTS